MLQRAFYLLHGTLDLDALFRTTETEMIAHLRQIAGGAPASELLDGIFGPARRLYKRLAQYSFIEQHAAYERLARRPYRWLVSCAEEFAVAASRSLGRVVAPHEVIFDAPPVHREVQFQIDVFFNKERRYRPLGEVSPVVRTLAQQQFDDYVKRVRIFVHPRLVDRARELKDLPRLVDEAITATDAKTL
jgi:hypothetical protein